jgi:hypothetical protein
MLKSRLDVIREELEQLEELEDLQQWRTSHNLTRPDRTIKQLDKSPFHLLCIEKLNRQGGRDPPVYRNIPTKRDRKEDQKLKRVFSAIGYRFYRAWLELWEVLQCASNASAQSQALSSDGKDDEDCFLDYEGLVKKVLNK